MRKKLNKADQYFIENHAEQMTPEQISELIDLEYDAVFNYYEVAKTIIKNKRREASKGVTVLSNGDSQRADDNMKKKPVEKMPNYIWRD